MITKIYEVRDTDGTSYTGVSTLVGFFLDKENAKAAAHAVKLRDSWHSGSIIEHPLKDWHLFIESEGPN